MPLCHAPCTIPFALAYGICFLLRSQLLGGDSSWSFSLRAHRSSSPVQTIASESSAPNKKGFIHLAEGSVEKGKPASGVQQHT